MTPIEVTRGDSPIVLGLPHTGTWLPHDVVAQLNDRGRGLDDTDWHIHRLYHGLLDGVTKVRATFHRYVIDANRDPSGQSLYPGQNTTGLVPLTDFDGHAIWETPPGEGEIAERRAMFHTPYHAALEGELERVRARHGLAILFDCHSIRSKIPYLFDGTLPDFNIGTNGGQTCAPEIEAAVVETCGTAKQYSTVLNGRFKGGWTTRHYGRPAEGLHAIQLELAQSTYLAEEKAPWRYSAVRAEALRRPLSTILHKLAALAPSIGGTT